MAVVFFMTKFLKTDKFYVLLDERTDYFASLLLS